MVFNNTLQFFHVGLKNSIVEENIPSGDTVATAL